MVLGGNESRLVLLDKMAMHPCDFAELADLKRAGSLILVERGQRKGSSPVGSGVFVLQEVFR